MPEQFVKRRELGSGTKHDQVGSSPAQRHIGELRGRRTAQHPAQLGEHDDRALEPLESPHRLAPDVAGPRLPEPAQPRLAAELPDREFGSLGAPRP